MRIHQLVIACVLANPINAQIVNGSFEMNGNPSLEGWEWTCGDPDLVPDAAPNAGSWSATKQPGHAKGCFPSYLFQRLPDVEHGDRLVLSGWVKCPDFGICQGGFIGLGRVNAGAFELEETVSAQDLDWTYISISDTVEIGPGDTAIVVLNSGFIGGPAFEAGTASDGIGLLPALSVRENTQSNLAHIVDRNTRMLYLSMGEADLRDIRLFDLTGKVLQPRYERTSASAVRVDLNALPQGVYFVSVVTGTDIRTIRFVNW
ncbi:MAG: T9SS type A sorting domain-containing protein [Flavobacteriales bacterium]|nr:T9SS type A sorting domain-containing protein [Flavobacteriales bacterium]